MTGTIEARGVDVVFTSGIGGRVRKAALSDVSLSVGGAQPSITAVVGESGSGKTTLTRLLLGFQSATSGEVLYNGQPMNALSGSDLRTFRRDVQAIFQDPFEAFNPFYKVEHPLVTPLRTFGLARSRDEALHLVEQAMETVGLRPQETIGKYPHQLSGGQRQRIMIARSLALRPSVILADEPVSMVDASLRSTILEMLWKLNRDQGIALIYVTHDLTILLHHHCHFGPRSATTLKDRPLAHAIASCGNVFVKLSGQGNVAGADEEYPYPDLDWLRAMMVELFPGRVVWGSDFPVSSRHTTYRQSMNAVLRHTPLTSAGREAAMGRTMARLLGLSHG